MEHFLHQMFSGIASGAIYSSLALALVMVYRSTHHVNFAQGEMAMFSTYIALALIEAGVGYWWAFALTLLLSFALGMGIERLLVRPATRGSSLSVVIVFIALLAIFHSLASWLFSPTLRQFPSPFPAGSSSGLPFITHHGLGAILITLGELVLVYLFFRFTRTGLAMRAVAQNPVSSRLVGIRAGRMLALGWGLAAMLGAVAGIMIAPVVYLDPNMMSGVLLYGFASALLGGIDRPWGAVAGGFIVGLLDNLIGAYLVGSDLRLSVALVLILGVLMFKPAGLFGKPSVTRV